MTEVAHGVIKIDVRDEEALAALRRLDNELGRTMDNIDREKATAKANLDTSDIDQEVKNAQRKLKKLEGHKSTLKADGRAFKRVRQEIEDLNKELKKLTGKQAEIHLKFKGDDERIKAISKIAALEAKEARIREQYIAKVERIAAQSAKRIHALEKALWLDERKAHSENARRNVANEKARMAAINRRARVSASLRSQEAREMAQAERAAHAEEAARNRAAAALQRELDGVHDLRVEYIKTAREIEAYGQRRRDATRARDPLKVQQVDINHERAMAKLDQLRERLENIGEPPPVVDLHIQPGKRFGEDVRRSLKSGGIGLATYHVGQEAGTRMVEGFRSRFNRETFTKANALAVAGGGVSRVFQGVGRLAAGLSSATVRIGPFTATIRQALTGLAALGPLIVDVVGSLGALVGVVGSATVGFGALGVGMLGGAIPAFAGMFSVIKPVVGEFKNAMKASKAYDDALRKGNTDLAAKKMKELKAVLGNVDDETVKNFRNAGKLSEKWAQLTKPGRAEVFKTIGAGLGFASDNAEMFSRNTNESLRITGEGVRKIISNMNTAEGRNALATMMKNFNRTLEPALAGVANLGVYLGRVGRIASGFLPGMGRGFERWSRGLADGAEDSDKLREKISGVVESLKSVGRFSMSAGRFLKAFFGGAVDSGRDLTDTMTNAMNRWTQFLGTARGQERLGNFFDRSVSGAKALYGALAPIISAFVSWASALSPVVAGLLQGVGAVGGFVSGLLRMTGLTGPLTALATTLGALWAVGRIGAAAAAVGNFTRALIGLSAASTGAAVAAGGAGGLAARTAAVGAASGVAASKVSRLGSTATSTATKTALLTGATAGAGTQVGVLRRAAEAVVPRIAKMGAIGGGLATAGLTTLAAAAVYGGYKFVTMKSDAQGMEEQLKQLGPAASNTARAFQTNARSAADVGSSVHQGRLQLKALRTQLGQTKRGTDEWKSALLQVRDQVRFNEQAERQWTQHKRNSAKASSDQVKIETKRRDVAKQLQKELGGNRSLKEALKAAVPFGFLGLDDRSPEKLRELQAEYKRLTSAAERAQNRQAALAGNLKREWVGLEPVLGKAEQQLGQLARQKGGKGLAQKIATTYEAPKNVGRVAQAAGAALKAKVPRKLVTNVVANSKGAEADIRRLNQLKIKQQFLRIGVRGGDTAMQVLRKLEGTQLGRKVLNILARDTDAKSKVRALIALGIPPKIAMMLGNNKDALAKARAANAQRLNPLMQIINRALGARPELTPPPPTTQTVLRSVKNLAKMASGGSFASGGGTGASPSMERIERARVEAEKRQVRDIRKGGRVTRPTILAGEENKTEFVIPTNPRYRGRAASLLRAAARAIGEKVALRDNIGLASGGQFADGMEFAADGRGVRAAGRKPPKGNRGLRLKSTPTKKMAAVNKWRSEEDRWTREASILEMRIDEPETFLHEVGKLPNGDPMMAVHQPTLTTYVNEMNAIKAAYQKALDAMRNLAKALKPALKEVKRTKESARKNIHVLNKEIERQEKRSRSKNKGVARQARGVLPGLRRKLSKQQGVFNNADTDLSTLADETREVPWRIREQDARIAEYQEDIDAVQAGAAKSAAEANKQEAAGSSSDLSYGQQVAASAAAQQRVLSEQGSNMNTWSGAAAKPAPTTDKPQPRMLSAGGLAAAGGALAATGESLSVATSPTSAGVSTAGAIMAGSISGYTGATTAGDMATGGGAPTGGAPTTTVFNQTNNFEQPPDDPHIWSKGVEYEMGAIL